MKLYFSPGACSLSPHIALREAGLAFELEQVDTRKHVVEASNADFYAINPNGYVPVLELDDGQRLTEGPAIVQYIADKAPESGLAPKNGTFERVRLQEVLNFISTEIHKTYGALFNPSTPEAYKTTSKERLSKRYDHVTKLLAGKNYLLGDRFTVADGYLFTVTNWSQYVNFDITPWPVLAQFQARVAARPAVVEALKAEKLIK